MRGRLNRHEIVCRIKIRIFFDGFHHLRQYLMHMVGINTGHIKPHAILWPFGVLRIRHAVAGIDFSHNGTAHHISCSQIGMAGSILFHECLAIGIAKHAAFRSCRFRQQNAGMRQTSRVELHEFAVFKLQSRLQCESHAVAGQIP